MSFSEAVSIISAAGRARLQNSATNPTASYDLVQNGTVQGASTSSNIRLNLDALDLNSIKANTSIGTSLQDTYLVLQDNFARDISGNLLMGVSQNGIQASTFIPDTTRPRLLMSNFDLNAGMLRLRFDEPISMTFDASQVFLTNQMISAPGGYNLTDSIVVSTSDQSTSITLALASPALDMIKSDAAVCNSRSNCLIFLTMSSFSDMSGNPLQPSAASTLVSTFIPDTTSPSLVSYTIDLNDGFLTLTFSEPIIVQTFSAFGLQLQGQTQGAGMSVRLSGSVINETLEYDTVLVLNIAMILNMVKQLATSGGLNLIMETLTASDNAGNMVQQIPSSNPLAPSAITPDRTPPTIIGFMPGYPNEQQLTLVFDEYVNPSSLNTNRMTLTLITSIGPVPYTGIQGTTSSSVGTTIVIMLPGSMFVPPFSDQYNEAYFEGTVVFRADSGFISDLGNNAIAVPQMETYRNSTLPTDVDPPVLQRYDLDLNTGSISMTFNEDVEIVTVAGQVTFQNSASLPTAVYNIMRNASDISPTFASDVVTVTLDPADLNGLKLNPTLATSIANTYLILMSSFVMDTAGNFIEVVTSGTQVTLLTPDTRGPSVTAFDLDLDSDQMTLSFDEPVRVSTFDETKITLTNASNLSITNRTSVQIMNVEVPVMPSAIVTSIRFLFRINDTINVKSAQLCYDSSNCFALFGPGLISDVSNNPSPSATTTALQVGTLAQDVTPPRLTAFRTFDLNSGLFVLIFSEPVNGSSTDYTDIEFLNAATNPTVNITLNEGFTTPDHVEIDFILSRNDLNIIKDTPGLCTSLNNCFISLPSFFITDIGMNPFLHQNYAPQAVSGIHQPLQFLPDTTPPELESYTLDMNVGNMMLTFSEVVQMSTFMPNGLTLFNATNGTVSQNLSSQSQYTFSGVDNMISITFTETDFTLLKAQDLCSSIDDTFLGVQMRLLDTSNNPLVNITAQNAIQAATFIADRTNPTLSSFDLFNIDNGSFIITFSEPVELSSVQFTLITFLAQPNSQMRYTLTGGEVSYINEFKRSILITLSMTDRVQIKLVSGLAVSQASTYISLGQGMCNDRFSNPLVAVSTGQPVMLTGQYILDLTEASLQSFSLDMNTGQVMLTFNDVIDATSVDVTSLTIQSGRMISNDSYTLTSLSTIISTSSNIITIMIQNSDLNTIKLNLNLATTISNTYISFPANFATSLERNAVIAVPAENAVGARLFTPDMSSPQLSSFDLDMNSGSLTLTFNEPVLVSTTNIVTFLIFSRAQSASSGNVKLNGGLVLTLEETSISLQILITNDDLNTLKSSTILATSTGNTYLRVQSEFIMDVSGNGIQVETVQASRFIPDTTPPELLNFNANLTDTGTLTLQFSEAVVYLNGAQASFALTNSTSNPFTSLPLSTSMISQSFLGVIEINLASTLLNRLLIDTSIASSTRNLFITISEGGISDYSSNGIEEITVTEAQRVKYLYRNCFDLTTYNNISRGTCERCPDACSGGCTGEGLTVGQGGCKRCYIATFDRLNNLQSCVPQSTDCPNGYYDATSTSPSDLTQLTDTVCKPCHEHCSTCILGPLSANCQSCMSAIMLSPLNGQLTSCLDSCANVTDPTLCQECHPQCDGCSGPTNQDCVACREDSLPGVSPLTCVPQCDSGQYLQTISQGMYECRPCNNLCTECTGPATTQCLQCTTANVTDENGQSSCVPSCPANMFIDYTSSLLCTPCHDQCSGGCGGPTNTNCSSCAQDSMVNSLGVTECVQSCPTGHSINVDTKQCELTGTMLIVIIACSVGGGVILIALALVGICVCVCCVRRRKDTLQIERVTLVEEKSTSEPVMTATTSRF